MKRYLTIALSIIGILVLLVSCSAGASVTLNRSLGNGWRPERTMELQYAKNFSVNYYSGGYVLLSMSDGSRFLVVPEGSEVPGGIDLSITVLKRPIKNIYLVATSAMALFDALDSIDTITLSGSEAESWYVENARKAMEEGRLVYAGKYSAPDYELIMSKGSSLAIESTMINHVPEVKEKLEKVGIPVLIEQTSYESHPLARTEWIKFYGALLGKDDLAQKLFDEQIAYMNAASSEHNTGKTVAYFYISSSGKVVARKSGDYVAKMIELAGGNYIFKNLGDPEKATSTVTLEMEQFYATAKDADYIIYNSTIDGGVSSLAELLAKNPLLKSFKAVQDGNVWCTDQDLYQASTQLGLMISDMHRMLTDDGSLTKLHFIYKLQ